MDGIGATPETPIFCRCFHPDNACDQRVREREIEMKDDITENSVASHCYRAALWGFAMAFTVSMFCMVGGLIHQSRQAHEYRRNAMDLCAWHARRMNGNNVSSKDSTKLWKDIANGTIACPFCGQKHNANWVSRNAWESQINAMEAEE